MQTCKLNLVSNKPIEWAADCYAGYFGYKVHIDNGTWPKNVGFPAFTHEQMLECKRINEELGERYSFDEFPHLVYNDEDKTWSEVYYDDMSDIEDILEPFVVDGIELYALGMASSWAWGECDNEHEYERV